jgi:hypothetical protein
VSAESLAAVLSNGFEGSEKLPETVALAPSTAKVTCSARWSDEVRGKTLAERSDKALSKNNFRIMNRGDSLPT